MAGPMDWPSGEDEDVDVAGGEDVMGMSASDFGEKGLNAMLMSLFFFFWLIFYIINYLVRSQFF